VNGRVKELAAEGGRGHRDGRPQEVQVTDAGPTPIPCHLIGVEREDLVELQKDRPRYSARRLKTPP
jgi:hypothetical protein